MPKFETIDECGRRECDGKTKLLDLHLQAKDKHGFHDRLYQCEKCLSIFQAFYKDSDAKIHHGTIVSGVGFIHKAKGKWVL